jgi:hypothetical protein
MMQRRHVNEEKENEEEVLDFSKPDYVFIPKGHHTYRQVGPYLTCKSCELQHAIWIGMEKVMIGEDENGQPILIKRIDYEKKKRLHRDKKNMPEL